MTRLLPLAVCVFSLFACAEKPEEKPKEKKEVPSEKPQLVGRVASIQADRKFVLIQAYGTWRVATGSILTTQGPDGRAANLLATGEKLGQYAAADIQSGTLEIGDGVYTITKTPAPAVTEDDTPPSDEATPAEAQPTDGIIPDQDE